MSPESAYLNCGEQDRKARHSTASILDGTCVAMARINCMLYGLGGGHAPAIKNTAEQTPEEVERFPETHKSEIQQTLFALDQEDF